LVRVPPLPCPAVLNIFRGIGGGKSDPRDSIGDSSSSSCRDQLQLLVIMAAAALLRSLGSKMARAPPTLLARGLHGGACSGHGGSWCVQRGLHNSTSSGASGSVPPISKTDLHTARSKIRAGAACVMLFGSMVYMYISVFPRLEAKLLAKKISRLNAAYANEALNILLAEHASADSPDAQIMQSSGHGKQPEGETGKGSQTRLEYLEAEITKLKMELEQLEAGRSK
ncbi:unnamed protein product, partial [Urochloa humidicola]